MAGSNFRVVIVGGSVSGLSLALMLEKNAVDFVLLEAYPEIAPQVGAAIALLPNGNRVLDQLGCYDDVLKSAKYAVDDFLIHDTNGKLLTGVNGLRRELVDRHGYPMIFFERKNLIDILYSRIKSKDKVLTSKRVVSAGERDEKVVVTTEDGSAFEGDVAIGADGMHSAIRREIEKKAPSPADLRTDTLPADYGAVFGIARADLKTPKGSVVITTRKGSSIFVASGPEGSTYWCLFFHLGKQYFGDDVPCRGAKAEEEYSKQFWDHPITENYTYSELRKATPLAVATPLHEYVIKNWHSGRGMTIGDSVHKVNPISGQGGNAAIETAAALTNALVKLVRSNDSGNITKDQLHSALEGVQELRKPRATSLCERSRMMQRLYAESSTFFMVMNRYVLPIFGSTTMLARLGDAYPPAVSLDTLELPARPRTFLYHDELIHRPRSRNAFLNVLISVILLGLSALASHLLLGLGEVNGTFRLVESAAATSFLSELTLPIQSFFGPARFPGLDKFSKTMVAVFLPVVSGAADVGSKLQAGYFLISVHLPLLSIIAIEGYRWTNKGTLLWSPSLWTGLAQLLGLGVIFPLYLVAIFYHTRTSTYWMSAPQAAPAHKLSALLPSLIIGYLVPSVLLVTLPASSPLLQAVIVLWQASPLAVILLTELLSRPSAPPPPKPTSLATTPALCYPASTHRASGVHPAARRIYAFVAAVAALTHIGLVAYYVLHSPSLVGAFLPFVNNTDPRARVDSIAQGMATFFQFDLLATLAGVLAWSLLTLHDLRRVGLAHTGVGIRSVAALLAGWVVLGPGAATAVLWGWWREETVCGFVPRRMAVAKAGGREKE